MFVPFAVSIRGQYSIFVPDLTLIRWDMVTWEAYEAAAVRCD